MLKRQLQSRYGLTPDQYRDKWGLPHDYPMVAPDYAETRSALAKSIGLGRKPAATAVIEAPAPAPRRPRKKSTRERRLTAAGNRSPPLSPPPSPPPTGSSCQRPSLCAGGGAGQRYGGAGEGPLRWSQLPVKPTWCPSRIRAQGAHATAKALQLVCLVRAADAVVLQREAGEEPSVCSSSTVTGIEPPQPMKAAGRPHSAVSSQSKPSKSPPRVFLERTRMSCRKSIASLGGHRDAAAMSNPASAFVTPSPQASGVAQVKNMACSSTALFSEPEDFEAAAWAASRPRLLVTAPGCFKARLTEVALGAMRLSAVEEALPRIAVLKVPANIVLVMLPIGRLSAPVWGGVMSQQWELTTHGPGQRLYGWTGGPCRWGAIWMSVDELAYYGNALTGTRFVVPRGTCPWCPLPRRFAPFGTFMRPPSALQKRGLNSLTHRDAERALQQQVIHALVDCLSEASRVEETPARRRHQDLVPRSVDLLNDDRNGTLTIETIGAMLGISERGLRVAFQEQLGMAPAAYSACGGCISSTALCAPAIPPRPESRCWHSAMASMSWAGLQAPTARCSASCRPLRCDRIHDFVIREERRMRT